MSRFWSSILRLVAVAFLVPSCGALLYAQSTTDGAVGGTVYDSNGAVVANAKVVVRNNGAFALQDTDTKGIWLGGRAQPVYTVRFAARELWGAQASPRDVVHVDLWEDYLERG